MNTLKGFKLIGVAGTFVLLLNASFVQSQASESERGNSVLTKVADIPMPGPAVRFDYQSLDVNNGRLYIAHMNADQLVVSPFPLTSPTMTSSEPPSRATVR